MKTKPFINLLNLPSVMSQCKFTIESYMVSVGTSSSENVRFNYKCKDCGSFKQCERDIGNKLMYCRACFVAWDKEQTQGHIACAELLKAKQDL